MTLPPLEQRIDNAERLLNYRADQCERMLQFKMPAPIWRRQLRMVWDARWRLLRLKQRVSTN